MDLGIGGLVAVAVLIVVGVVLWTRGRSLGGVPGGIVGRIDLAAGFPRTRRKGYAPADVDEVLDRAYGLVVTEEGRAEALELLHEAQFGLARRGGYEPMVVDLHVDAMITALQTGRGLPPRPGPGWQR
jgi:hypothetical protein